MAKPFHELRERLLRAGVAPRHVRRYLTELVDHLADLTAEENGAGRGREDAESAALLRLGGVNELSKAMMDQRQFLSWSVRAPWVMFGLTPLLLLAGAYFVACLILWSGWKIFLPGADTPFARIDGLAILYFGAGRLIYFSAPVVIGWGMVLIAARQRLKAVWPLAGLVLLALLGGTAQVHASRSSVASGAGDILMSFTFGSSVQGIFSEVIHILAILSLTMLPYLLWRLRMARTVST
ncbi:hypothetical protein [Acidipila rosea]|uniref:Uncharacterized protein n=1 Tax=Acidipila rosea TaxID=768535 RepID=A0A4R1L7F3_9BACT|nr:hypothetical protein [Acidipila rosea]TCK74124.1 hypothetical protein C7378_1746 [Acidipila rosea]